jgi:myo-inositol-1-phosphate synthase
MSSRRIGLWLIGAFGGVGTTLTLGLAAMTRRLVPDTGLVTALPMFSRLKLPAVEQFLVGGHEIRSGSFTDAADEFRRDSGVFDASLIDACSDELRQATNRVRPGVTLGAGRAIEKIADAKSVVPFDSPAKAIDHIAGDLQAFVKENQLDHLIVMNVSSTEPPFTLTELHRDWSRLQTALADGDASLLPASSLYAIAALRSGHTYINFTPSMGASFPAAYQLAESRDALHGGKDGKTGETLLKTVLAPMFAHRNLQVMSWVGHNIFGNRDGLILDDPVNKASKVGSKDQVVHSILGYKPATLVTIEYIPDMGDWKTAWDHIHFNGFLGSKMTMQFTWQGCDSMLAAPLAIDLARLADVDKQRGAKGLMTHLASFFKSPEGVTEHDFFRQSRMLEEYVARPTTEQ